MNIINNDNFYIHTNDKFVTSVDAMPALEADAVSSTFAHCARPKPVYGFC